MLVSLLRIKTTQVAEILADVQIAPVLPGEGAFKGGAEGENRV